jgi:hypothetical protein
MLHNHKPSDYRRPRYLRSDSIPPIGQAFTITETEEINKAVEGDEPDFRIRLTLDKWHWFELNGPNLDTVIELCGDDFGSWVGKRLGIIISQFQTKDDGMRTFLKVVPVAEIKAKRPLPSELKLRQRATTENEEIALG